MRLLIILFSIYLYASTNDIYRTNLILSNLAQEIIKNEESIKNIEKQEKDITNKLNALKAKLNNSNSTFQELNEQKKEFENQKSKIENEIINFISTNYYIDTKETSTIKDIIYSEIQKSLLQQSSSKINELIKKQKDLEKNLSIINNKISTIKEKQKLLQKIKNQLKSIKRKKLAKIKELEIQKNRYKKRLFHIVKKQKQLQKELQNLKIVKKKIKVKQIGSVYMKTSTASYYGNKTIPPVRGKIVKKFGMYIDPIYKLKIYNDSITIKTKPNSLVRSIFNGRIVFLLNKNDRKIVVIKHPNNMFSIYSNLSQISPLLNKGSYIKKGQIIGRVFNKLEFEITYKDKPINPLKVINLK